MVCVCKCNTASQRSAVRFSGYKYRLVTFEGKYVSELGDEYGWVCNRAAVGFGWKYLSVPI